MQKEANWIELDKTDTLYVEGANIISSIIEKAGNFLINRIIYTPVKLTFDKLSNMNQGGGGSYNFWTGQYTN